MPPASSPDSASRAHPIRAIAATAPDAVALEGSTRLWTYGELAVESERMARRLARAGVQRGDRVALLAPTGPEAVIAVHATPLAGASLVPLDPRWSENDLKRCVDALDPRCLLSTSDQAGRLPRWPARRRLDIEARGAAAHDPDEPAVLGDLASVIDLDAVHAVLWTSGTGGRPRGVPLSWRNQLASASAVTRRLGLGPADRWHCTLATAHVGGLAVLLRAALAGSRVLAQGPFDAETLATSIDGGRTTHVSLVPTMLHRLLEVRGGRPPPETFAMVLVGGAAVTDDLLDRALQRGYPVALTYGLTEAASQVATAPLDLVRRKPGTVGAPLDGVEVEIAHDGEIVVRGPTVWGAREAGGWLHTGDRGFLDDEGDLWVTGRLDDRIISAGFTIDPIEIENALASHAAVAEAAVIGIPDAEWGEIVAAAVVVRAGYANEADAIDQHAGRILGPAKRPRVLAVVDRIPRNANGKVDRAALRRLVRPP